MSEEKPAGPGIIFEGIGHLGEARRYPAWRYHPMYEPRIVNDTEEDEQAYREGWKQPQTPVTANHSFHNFYHDLEDMNCRQLAKYAKAEFNADLPAEAPKAMLLDAIWTIARHSEKTKGRIILLAQSMRMNLDETHEQIRRMAGEMDKCQEVEVKEIWL